MSIAGGNSGNLKPAGMPSSAHKRSGLVAPTSLPVPKPAPLKKADSIHFTDDTENFIVGDRVWVYGTKPGRIQFLGETKFAAGEWAGVVLDEPEGKNDGTVNGVQYFQCENLRGVFVRLHKLSRKPLTASEIESLKQTKLSAATSVASISRPSEGTTNLTPEDMAGSGLKAGMRVWLSGDRCGIIRFIGTPHFQPGVWAGIELDDPKGKNDGSVDGQRYFSCRPNHGVFAPIAKVSKVPLGASGPGSTSSRLRREASQESIMSSFSVRSTASRRTSGIRLGTSSLSPATLTVARTGAGTPAEIMRAHQEKDAIITNLTRERDRLQMDLDSKVNKEKDVHTEMQKVQQQYLDALAAHQTKIDELVEVVKTLNDEKTAVYEQLEDEKRKVEDLQFRLEEEISAKESSGDSAHVDRIFEEKNREIQSLKMELTDIKDQLRTLKDDMDHKDQEMHVLRNSHNMDTDRLSQVAKERDKMAFEVADLNRQLRESKERHESELAAVQKSLEGHTISESALREQIDLLKEELRRAEESAVPRSDNQEQLQLLERTRKEVEEKERLLSEVRMELAEARKLAELTGPLQSDVKRYQQVMIDFAGKLGVEKADDDYVTVIVDAVSRVVAEVEAITTELKAEKEQAAFLKDEHAVAADDMKSRLETREKELEEVHSRLSGLESLTNTLQSEKDKLIVELSSLSTNGTNREEVEKLHRIVSDLTKEKETVDYQLSELQIEIADLKSTNQELNQQVINAADAHRTQLEQLMRNKDSDIEALKREFEKQREEILNKLHNTEAQLNHLNQDKSELNKEIARFIEVLREKDAELKDARQHIEKSFASEVQEKQKLSELLTEKQHQLAEVEKNLMELQTSYAEKCRDVDDLKELFATKEKEVQANSERLEELQQKNSEAREEMERMQAAFAEQMMLTELRSSEKLNALSGEKQLLITHIASLEDRLAALQNQSSIDVADVEKTYEEKLCVMRSDLEKKASAVKEAEGKAAELFSELQNAKKQSDDLQSTLDQLRTNMLQLEQRNQTLSVENANLQQQYAVCSRLASEASSGNEQLAAMAALLEAKERELNESSENLKWANQRIKTMEAESAETTSAFTDQLTLAQLRLDELRASVQLEQNASSTKIGTLEDQLVQLSASLKESVAFAAEKESLLSKAGSDLRDTRELLVEREKELSLVRDTANSAVKRQEALEADVRTLQAVLTGLRIDLQQTGKERDEALLKLSEQESILSKEQSELEELRQSQTSIAKQCTELESRLRMVQLRETDLKAELNGLRREFEESQSVLQTAENRLKDLSMQSSDDRVLRSELERLSREGILLTRSVEEKAAREQQLNGVIEELRKEITDLKAQLDVAANIQTKADRVSPTLPTVGRDLEQLLDQELKRVRGEVEFHRRQIEQKDSELFKVKQQTRQLIDQKDAELNQLKSKALEADALLRKERLGKLTAASSPRGDGDSGDIQVHILNSIIADQQRKIVELEAKISSNSNVLPKQSSSVEGMLSSKQKVTRLYCGTCQVFDSHDGLDCPKKNKTSPERERKPKAARAPRKYCDNCEVFEKHETAECPHAAR